MHGASLHRRHRFRAGARVLWPYPAVRHVKAASRQGLPHAVQDASRSHKRWASVLACLHPRVSLSPPGAEATTPWSLSGLHSVAAVGTSPQKKARCLDGNESRSIKNRAMRDPLLSHCKALALAARWCRLGLFLLRLFDFLFVSVVAFGHNDVRVVGCARNVAAPLAACKTRLPTFWNQANLNSTTLLFTPRRSSCRPDPIPWHNDAPSAAFVRPSRK